MPTFTIISCIQEVIRCGATPVLGLTDADAERVGAALADLLG